MGDLSNPVKRAVSQDGIEDPLKDAQVYDPERTYKIVAYCLDSTGKLRRLADSDGDLRTKHFIPDTDGVQLTTTSGTPVTMGGSSDGFRILALYQNSGGPLDFTIETSSADNLYVQTAVPSATFTLFDDPQIMWGPLVQCAWSGAAGANQFVALQRYTRR